MANVLGSNPLVLDTTTDPTILFQNKALAIKRITWQSTTTGDVMLLQDGNGNVIATHTTTANNETLHELIEHTFDGLDLVTLSHGKLYVHLN